MALLCIWMIVCSAAVNKCCQSGFLSQTKKETDKNNPAETRSNYGSTERQTRFLFFW